MQVLRKRFEGHEEEKIMELKLIGWSKFGQENHCTPEAVQKWLHEQRGHEHARVYSYISKETPVCDLPLAKQLILKFEGFVRRLKDKITELHHIIAQQKATIDEKDREILFLREQVRHYQSGEYATLKPFFDFCEQEI